VFALQVVLKMSFRTLHTTHPNLESRFHKIATITSFSTRSNNNNNTANMKDSTSYVPVKQIDDPEDPPVIVVNPLEVVHQEHAEQQAQDVWNQAKCAGCVGACAGCLTGGFWLSLACGTGCVYAAKQHDGTIGDLARACGNFGIKANVMARESDNKHNVVDNTKQAAVAAWNKAKTLNQEYQIVAKTKECVKSGVKTGVEFTKEHRLAERTYNGVGKVLSAVVQEIASDPDIASAATSDPESKVTTSREEEDASTSQGAKQEKN
jgi:hypothetical protein